MIHRKKETGRSATTTRSARVEVEIFYSKVTELAEAVENVVLYGFVCDRAGQVFGYTFSCTVYWRTNDYSLDSGNETSWSSFKKLIRHHVGSREFTSEAVVDMTLADSEFDEPVGVGMGTMRFNCTLAN